MEENQFDLGEALGSYEQAQADRNFYLSMVQGGTQMASPIAAYLAGVAGVKMANQRAKVQDIQDARQAKLDATAAAEKAQKRAMDLDNQIINIMKGARDGSIAPSAAAGMLGYAMKERGYIPKGYDADNNIMTYGVPGDEQDYQVDLGESETSKSQREWYKLQLAEKAEERKREQGTRSLDIQQQRANTYARRASGESPDKLLNVSDFNRLNPKIEAFMKAELPFEDQYPTQDEIISYIKMLPRLQKYAQDPAYENILNVMNRLGYSADAQKAIIERATETVPASENNNNSSQDFSGISNNDFLKMMPTK